MTTEATAAEEEVVDPVEPEEEVLEDVEEEEEIPTSQLQQFIDNQAQLQAQLLEAQREVVALQAAQSNEQQTTEEQQLAESQATALNEHIRQKETDYSEALIAGDKDKAAAIYTELETARAMKFEAAMAQQQAQQQAALEEAMKTQLANERFLQKVEAYTSQHPELDSNSKQYNQELTSDINELTNAYRASGMPADKALDRAVTMMSHNFTEPVSAQASSAPRKTLKEKLGDAGRQPGTPAGKGTGDVQIPADVVDINALSDDEFAKLDPTILAKMRGDALA